MSMICNEQEEKKGAGNCRNLKTFYDKANSGYDSE
jgi:hypothetical protein